MTEQAQSRFRVFVPQSEVERLPSDVTVEQEYAAYSIVLASESAMDQVREQYPVEKLEPPSPQAQARSGASLAAAVSEAAEERSRGPYTRTVYFRYPVQQSGLEELENIGCEVREAVERQGVVVTCPNKTALAKLEQVTNVERVDPYVPSIQISPQFLQRAQIDADDPQAAIAAARIAAVDQESTTSRRNTLPGTLVASFFTPEEQQRAKRSFRRQNIGDVTDVGETSLAINLAPSDDPVQAILTIVRRPGLRRLEEKTIKKLYNNVARQIVANRVTSSNPGGLGLTGEGEIIAIADSGLDTGDAATVHADFLGRLRNIRSFPIAPSYSQFVNNPGGDDGPADRFSGHGTHVCGSALGNGARSIDLGLDPIQGVAPEAELVFQAIEQTPHWKARVILEFILDGQQPPPSGLYGIPDDLQDLFQAAYDEGARIHSNSWGGGEPGAYDLQCEQLDRFVWNHKDLLVLVAAGNDGTDAAQIGNGIDPTSVTSPGTAKNCLTVGASENNRSGEFTDTYGAWWPNDYPQAPFKSDSMVDSIDDIVAFSSRGPCTTGRRKPDVVAPGTFILSTRSSQMPANNFAWGAFPLAKRDYMFMGGTSMATPLVAGCAALIRQYLRENEEIANPSAALLKATLIHSAQYLPYRYAHPTSSAWADDEQGWGRVDLQRVLNPQEPIQVLFIDDQEGLQANDVRQTNIYVADSSVPLRITMVYTDFPGENLVNNLNLLVRNPDGTFFVGNDFAGTNVPDSKNNVEGIVVENPLEGTWTVQVVASDIFHSPQDFALVLSGGGIQIQS